jgi:hypothetical protein
MAHVAVPADFEQTANLPVDGQSKVFDQNVSEDAMLEALGYQAELKRSFGLIGMIGFSFSIVTSWTALSGVLVIGIESYVNLRCKGCHGIQSICCVEGAVFHTALRSTKLVFYLFIQKQASYRNAQRRGRIADLVPLALGEVLQS